MKRDRTVAPGSTIEDGGAMLVSPSRVSETGSGTLSASSAAPRGRGAVEIAASSVVIHCCFTSLAGLEFLPLPWHQQLEVGELTSVSSRIRTTNQRVSPRQRGSGLEMGQEASSPEHSIASHSNPAQYSCGFPSTPKRVMLRDRCIPTAPGSDVQLARRGFEYR